MSDGKQELIAGLNEDLAAEFEAIIFYTVAANLMTGPNRPELKEFFEGEIQDELGHARFLSHKIVALGGEPTTEPRRVRLGESNRERLEIALEAEKETIGRYRQRVEQAERFDDPGLVVALEDLIRDETEHKEEMEMILREYEG